MDFDSIILELGGVAKMAARIGQKRTTVAMWRKRGVVPPRHVPSVASALGVSIDSIWPVLAAPEPHDGLRVAEAS